LIVDDHQNARGALRELLELAGLVVTAEAEDGERAIALVAATQPDLVIMDIRMPGVDGISATRTIRELFPAVRVVGHSGFADDKLCAEMLAAGAESVIVKGTFSLEQLLGLVGPSAVITPAPA
jgi:DNA-binding NarL/FixJ family response regulator